MTNFLFRNSVVLDTETSGLQRSASVYEIAIKEMGGSVQRILPNPHVLTVNPMTAQEWTSLRSSQDDTYSVQEGYSRWEQAFEAELGSKWTSENRFLNRMYSQNPLFREQASKMSVHETLQAVEGMVKGKVVWIFNAPFEAKHIGALANAVGYQFGNHFETRSTTNEPFYVTGVEVQKARAVAHATGDWTGVWSAYKKYTDPNSGLTQVRDVQDVSRAIISYGKKLGWINADEYLGSSADVLNRVLGSLSEDASLRASLLNTAESHIATEDVDIEDNIVRRLARLADTAEAVHGGSSTIDSSELRKFYSRLDVLQPELREINVTKRIARAMQNLETDGQSIETNGVKVYEGDVILPDNSRAKTPRSGWKYETLKTIEDVKQRLSKQYTPELVERIHSEVVEQQSRGLALDTIGEMRAEKLADFIKTNTKQILASGPKGKLFVNRSNTFVDIASKLPTLRQFRGAMTGLAIAGTMLGHEAGNRYKERDVLSTSYDNWLAAQEGMSEQGVNQAMRQDMTDFGSPYQGPEASQYTLVHADLLREQEKQRNKVRDQVHFDPLSGIFSKVNSFRVKKFLRPEASGKYSEVDLRNYNVEVQDADTVTLSHRGLYGFWNTDEYSFRLAGIDAPETYHEGSWMAPQPYANEAKSQLQQIVNSGGLRLEYDNKNITYGRMIGVIKQGDKNINAELIARGAVMHLGYGKSEEAMVNYSAMRKAENRAKENNLGLWSHPWSRAVDEFGQGAGGRPTLNTLAKMERVSASQALSEFTTMANLSEQKGELSSSVADKARMLGQAYTAEQHKAYVPHQSHHMFTQLFAENRAMSKTRGTNVNTDEYNSKNFTSLNDSLALDTMGSTNSIQNQRRLAAYDRYKIDKLNRRAKQQRDAVQNQFQSHINHSRM